MPPVAAALGTKAIIALVLGTAGASAATNIYAAKRAGDTNRRSLDASERSDQRALAFEREEAARKERQYQSEAAWREKATQQAIDLDKQRWADYVAIHRPHWQLGASTLSSLYDLAGFTGGETAPAAMPTGGPPGTMAPAGTGAPPSAGLPPVPPDAGRVAAATRLAGVQPQTTPIPQGSGMSLADLMALANTWPSVSGTTPVPPPRPNVAGQRLPLSQLMTARPR